VPGIGTPFLATGTQYFVNSQESEVSPQELINETKPINNAGSLQTAGRRAPLSDLLRRIIRPNDGQVDLPVEAQSPKGIQHMDDPIQGVLANVKDFNPVQARGTESAISSDEIFREIGNQLRKRREMLSLTYEEIERHTRVRAVFLEALENGALEDLPSPVQTRGILANYAAFLDLDTDTILLRFADGLQARYREKKPSPRSRTRAPMTVNTKLPPLRTFIASDLVFGGGMAIMLLLFAIWGIGRVMLVRSSKIPQATSPSISDVLVGTPPATLPQQVTLIPAQDTSEASTVEVTGTLELATLPADINVQTTLTSIEQTFMRVVVDGKVQFEGRTKSGTDYSYQAKDQIEVLVGNAAGIKVSYNGRDLGLMGNFGEVVDRVYTAEGVTTPTTTPLPTPTATPKFTLTPTETITPKPSVTPTLKSGG
jgi:cytoskeletal protein RodZ